MVRAALEGGGDIGDSVAGLARFVDELRYADLPDEVVEREKWHVLDSLGCLLYGTTTPWVQKVVRTLVRLGEAGPASVVGTDQRLSPARAALVHGMATHSMDFDDHCQDAGVHAGSAVLPSLLAYCETADRAVSGREAIVALTAGVETSVRAGLGISRESIFEGWHIAGWTGAFAAAATTAKLSGLEYEQLAHAIGLAGTQGSGLMGAVYGAEVKRYHMGRAAESGYLAASFADEGLTGDRGIFEERWGSVTTALSDGYEIDRIVDGVGDTYELLHYLTFKPFPSVGQVHPSVNALQAVVEAHGLTGEDVEHVTVHLTERAKQKAGWAYEPLDVMSAQSSIQYALAAFLQNGRLTVDDYTPAAIGREAVLDRIDDIAFEVDGGSTDGNRYRTVVEVRTRDGRTHRAEMETPKGFPENPMSAEELLAKFHQQAGRVVGADDAAALVEFVLDLERQDDLAPLLELVFG